MGDLASLLLGVAAIITAVGSSTAGIIVAVRGSKKERRDASRATLDRITGEDGDKDDDDLQEAIEHLRQQLEQRGDQS